LLYKYNKRKAQAAAFNVEVERGKSGHSRAMCHVKAWVQQGKPAVTDQCHRKQTTFLGFAQRGKGEKAV